MTSGTGTSGLPPARDGGHALSAAVDAELTTFLSAKRAMLTQMDPGLLPVADELAGLCSTGSRLHPALAYWAWHGFRGVPAPAAEVPTEPGAAVLRAVSALELLEVGTRVHEEAMRPAAAPRPGRTATQLRFAARHRTDRLDGGSAAFGRGVAILVGDLALVWSDELLNGSGISPAALARAGGPWDLLRTELVAARYLELFRASGGSTRLPTPGRRSVQRALELGAVLAGAGPAAADVCASIGRPLDDARRAPADQVPGLTGRARAAIAAAPLADGARAALDALAVAAGGSVVALRGGNGERPAAAS